MNLLSVNNRIKIYSVFLLFLATNNTIAQDSTYARQVIKTLTAPNFEGRGYVNEGDSKAAKYIAYEFKRIGLQSFEENNYFQPFSFPVNKFPYDVKADIDGLELIPGKDFIVSPDCPPVLGEYDFIRLDSQTLDNSALWKKFLKHRKRNCFIIIDKHTVANIIQKENYNMIVHNEVKARGIIYIEDKFTWSVSTKQAKFPVISVKREIFKSFRYHINLNIQPQFTAGHETQNVVGYIKGTKYPDSFLVFTAHYDHLGRMGPDAYFSGANDNASGVAMLLDLAKQVSKQKNNCSVAFICFAGEEAGLIGSLYYTSYPFFPLPQIRFLFNMDLMGTGENGATIVNGTEYRKQFDTLVYLNNTLSLLPAVNIRGKASNSDHYFFSEKGVPSFFIYLMGNYTNYHDIYDTNEALPLNRYNQAYQLISNFLKVMDY